MKEPEHEDIKYLKQEGISKLLMKGMAETYRKQPGNPVDYFAKWLLNQRRIEREADQFKSKSQEKKELVKDFKRGIKEAKQKEAE